MSENPIVLVDSDKAGDDFINKYGKNPALEIHELKEIDANWKEMEDLFSAQDQKLLNTSDKKYRLSSYVKNHTDSISKQITVKTKENFKKLLNFLEN
jgi:succinylglutamate desuccinylase